MKGGTEDEDQAPAPPPLLARKPLSLPRPRRVRAEAHPHHSQPQGALGRSLPGDRRGARPERLQVAAPSSWHASPPATCCSWLMTGTWVSLPVRGHDLTTLINLTGWLVSGDDGCSSRMCQSPLDARDVTGVCEGRAVGPATAC